MQAIKVHDYRGEQVEPRNPVALALGSAIANFALTAGAEGVLERTVW
jgi:hypothetical protein